VFLGNMYGSGTGVIWLDNLRCNGNETSFDNCTHHGWGAHNCDHREDVSILCGNGTLHASVSTMGTATITATLASATTSVTVAVIVPAAAAVADIYSTRKTVLLHFTLVQCHTPSLRNIDSLKCHKSRL